MPRGGARVGAGRPPKTDGERWLGGDAGKRNGANPPAPAPPAPPLKLMPAPAGMPLGQAAVWNEFAPQACAQRTLSEQTAGAFGLLCKQVLLERRMFDAIEADGVQSIDRTAAHVLLTQYRGMMQRVESGMQRFMLTPMGKPLSVPEDVPVDPFSEFDPGTVQ